jgi:hypothetical protein
LRASRAGPDHGAAFLARGGRKARIIRVVRVAQLYCTHKLARSLAELRSWERGGVPIKVYVEVEVDVQHLGVLLNFNLKLSTPQRQPIALAPPKSAPISV